MFFTFIITTFKMTFSYSTEVSNLIDYELIFSNYDMINDKYTLDIHDKDKLYELIYDYVYIKEHKNIIKKIVDTYGMFNAIKLYQDTYDKSFNIEGSVSFINTYSILCIPIVEKNLKKYNIYINCNDYHTDDDDDDNTDDDNTDDEEENIYKFPPEITKLVDTDNILYNYDKDINGEYKIPSPTDRLNYTKSIFNNYNVDSDDCDYKKKYEVNVYNDIVYNYCHKENIKIIINIVETYGIFKAIIFYKESTGLNIDDDVEKSREDTYRKLSYPIILLILEK